MSVQAGPRARPARQPAACVCCASAFDEQVKHEGRGLCRGCWSRHRAAGTLHVYPRTTRPAAEVVGDYVALRERDPAATLAEHAGRLGMTRSALEQALRRARQAGLL